MTRSIVLLTLLTMSVPAVTRAAGKAAKGRGAVEDARSEVLEAEQNRNQALEKGDADALAKLYSDDLLYTNALGVTLSKQEHLADIRSRKLQLKTVKHSDVEVHVHGNTGFVTGISTSMVNFRGTASDHPRKFLNVYVKEDGAWRCVVHFETPAAKQ